MCHWLCDITLSSNETDFHLSNFNIFKNLAKRQFSWKQKNRIFMPTTHMELM